MKYALINYYEDFNQDNAAFDPEKFTLSADLNYWMILLRDRMKERGIDLTTPDQHESYDGYIFVDYPSKLPVTNKPMYLIQCENPFIRPENYHNLEPFKKVFSWWKCFNGIRVNIPQKLREMKREKKTGFSCLVSCNKSGNFPGELYSLRRDIAEYFTGSPDFDLYGMGWSNGYPNYKGIIKDKIDTVAKYKFSFCIENVYGLSGYLTEKLFDCLFAGTVPIYLGEPNISSILPANTAIYLKDFKDIKDLYYYLKSMSDKEYEERLNNIEAYVKGEAIKEYSAERFVDILMDNIFEKA